MQKGGSRATGRSGCQPQTAPGCSKHNSTSGSRQPSKTLASGTAHSNPQLLSGWQTRLDKGLGLCLPLLLLPQVHALTLKADLCRYAAEEACASTRQNLAMRCQAAYQLAWVRMHHHCRCTTRITGYRRQHQCSSGPLNKRYQVADDWESCHSMPVMHACMCVGYSTSRRQ
jgi:hypothetical protein